MEIQNKGKQIGIRIKELRNKKGLSQEDLQNRSGIQSSIISAIENNKRPVGLQTFVRIAEALEVPLDYLYYGDESVSFIENAPNLGAKIVNCFYELMTEGVVSPPYIEPGNGFVVCIQKYQDPIKRFLDELKQLEENKHTYSDIKTARKLLRESIATAINFPDSKDNTE